ncbi:CDP-glucose 4,6-dehydratase [Luteolibacter marinus]|uniref:CDP-glucose 4,6-dehydratase n=1 Tax=Luteolibacter marinus TaxID=2776705 RepID=UPI0018663FB4|nr:CDP-glucose 4,6-dehydratase [Luteolibacter marinus]
MFGDYYNGKRVLLTGHTGFKGSWLAEWLCSLGAEVHGYALDPQPHEVLYDQLGLSARLASDTRADLADRAALAATVDRCRPDIVLHLAAQPLVRLSYEIPLETFATNVMGTAHVLDALRSAGRPCALVCVTTDKCYENREWLHAYREEDAMGGHDPYSASKGAAELVISSYRRSFFGSDSGIRLASARAGNVIGGGDWALDRIVPDCIRALRQGRSIPVRNKIATRPWQHVLEPVGGYLHLAASLATSADPGEFASAFNFGPNLTSNRTVADLVRELIKHTGGEWNDASDPLARHEASKLNLAIDKAFHMLEWQPVWSFADTLAMTAAWYLGDGAGESATELTRRQIAAYQSAAASAGIPWACA